MKGERPMPGVRIVEIGVARPGIDVDFEGRPLGRLIANPELADELFARRDEVRDQLVPPDQWESLPPEERVLREAEWEQFATSDTWMRERSGIITRCRADKHIATSDLAALAIQDACRNAGWDAQSLDGLIVGTVLGDYITTPPTWTIVATKLGLTSRSGGVYRDISGADISCACTTFLKALEYGYALVASGVRQRVAVVGADVMSRTVSYYNRSPMMLLGDAAGVLLLEASDDDDFFGARSFYSGQDGEQAHLIITRYGGTRNPIDDPATIADKIHQPHRMYMAGPAVMAYFIHHLPEIVGAAVAKAGISLADIMFLAEHQANARMLDNVNKRLFRRGLRRDAILLDIDRYGNTTSASVPLNLHDAREAGLLDHRGTVGMLTMGGGLTWASVFCQMHLPPPASR